MYYPICPICGKDNCRHSPDELVVKLSELLQQRLETAVERPDFARLHVEPGASGVLPLLFKISPGVAPDLASSFWLKRATNKTGLLHQTQITLVEVPGDAKKILYLHESEQPISSGVAVYNNGYIPATIAGGRGTEGFFLLSLEKEPKHAEGYIILEEAAEVAALNNLEWQKQARFSGILRKSVVQDQHQEEHGQSLVVYDHRRELDDTAVVRVTEKAMQGRRWVHFDLYPADSPPTARIEIGRFHQVPVADGEELLWSWHSTSTNRYQRTQSVTLLAVIAMDTAVSVAQSIEVLRQDVEILAEERPPDAIALCNALEDLVVALVANGDIYPDESAWGKYHSLRARAEGTPHLGESATSWKFAIFALAKLAEFPFGFFDDFVSDLYDEILAAVE